jgi:hypothetical protein
MESLMSLSSRRIVGLRLATLIVIAAFFQACPGTSNAPLHVYLTWQGDTSTTMTVNFQTSDGGGTPTVYYDSLSQNGWFDRYAYSAQGTSHQIDGLVDGRYIHSVELTALEPGTTYYFTVALGDGVSAVERKFRTIPAGDEPIRFFTGGDMYIEPEEELMLEQAIKVDPMFGLIGGDIAYDNGRLDAYQNWDIWLSRWESIMVTSEGHMVPMVLAIGNHEVATSYGGAPEDAPFYMGYFAQGTGRSFFSLTFGANLVIYVLDSGHLAFHGGDQRAWLDQAMANHEGLTHHFAVYHVPLYPSHRQFMGEYSFVGRREWVPVFDKHGLDTAFENHDHLLKRTKRMKNGMIDPMGTMYLGDGCFGRPPRAINEYNWWYLDVARSTRHFWSVEVNATQAAYTAIGIDGTILDQIETVE